MKNVIKKIAGNDVAGNPIIADAAVTNMYTDENGDLNIKTSEELGDTEDAKIIITGKEVEINADDVKINNTPLEKVIENSNKYTKVELTDYITSGEHMHEADSYTYNGNYVYQYVNDRTYPSTITFKIIDEGGPKYIKFRQDSFRPDEGYLYVLTYDTGHYPQNPVTDEIKSLFGDVAAGSTNRVYPYGYGLMTDGDKYNIETLLETVEDLTARIETLEEIVLN